MLVRAYRITDRLGNAFLRISAWAAMLLVEQITGSKRTLAGFITALWHTFTGVTVTASRQAVAAAQTAVDTTSRTARQVTTRHQESMAQRAAEAGLKPAVTEDPLRAQNRALSAFAVLLLLILLSVVALQTGDNGDDNPVVSGGSWPEAQNTQPPTAIFPTPLPTPTPIPDPLREGGSLVYTLRDNGQDDLWAISVG
jgi:hypothetical protein